MPYVSDKQRRYFHAQKGKKVPSEVVDEFDEKERKKNKKKCKIELIGRLQESQVRFRAMAAAGIQQRAHAFAKRLAVGQRRGPRRYTG